MDLSLPDAAEHLHGFCVALGLQVEVLVNNAGIFRFEHIVNLSVGVVRTMLMLHMNTVVLLCRYFGEDMRKRGKGYILPLSGNFVVRIHEVFFEEFFPGFSFGDA